MTTAHLHLSITALVMAQVDTITRRMSGCLCVGLLPLLTSPHRSSHATGTSTGGSTSGYGSTVGAQGTRRDDPVDSRVDYSQRETSGSGPGSSYVHDRRLLYYWSSLI